MNGCYKGLYPGDRCVAHKDGCPQTLTPEERAKLYVEDNHPGLALWSPGLFLRTLTSMLREAEEQGRKLAEKKVTA